MQAHPDAQQVRKRISGSIMRLRQEAAFFAVLAMHADYKPTLHVPTAATDGRKIYFNPEFFARLTREELTGVILHEVLHCAYLHIPRRGLRDPHKWNIAADLVINPMVEDVPGAKLPIGALLDPKYAGKRVEEVYDMLPEPEKVTLTLTMEWQDLRSDLGQDGDGHTSGDGDGRSEGQRGGAQARRMPVEELGSYWRNAVNGAVQAHQAANGKGTLPAGAELLVEELNDPEVDWRELLWQYTVQHPHDFGDFDHRLVGRGVYEEALEGEKLDLHVAVDTSGSCLEWVTPFLSELNGILTAFPHVKATLSYVDAALHGPYEVENFLEIPQPKGGGGTSFVPFFEHVENEADPLGHHVLVYLTDGYGDFPAEPPSHETIWVVTPGGLDSDVFPFGKAIRLRNDP